MPKRTKKRPQTGAGGEQASLILCRCRTKCLKLNGETGRYEGKGQYVSLKTRAVHRRDERLQVLMEPVMQRVGHRTMTSDLPDDTQDEEYYQHRWEDVIQAFLDVLNETPAYTTGEPLVFVNDPKNGGEYQYEYSNADEGEPFSRLESTPNTGKYALSTPNPLNSQYIERENILWNICRMLESFSHTARVIEMHGEAYGRLCALEEGKALEWETQRESYTKGPHFNTEIFFRQRLPKSKQHDAASLVSLVLQFQYFLPRRGCELYLAGISDILRFSAPSSTLASSTLKTPVDPRPLAARFNLDPITTAYVSCPECHCLYSHKGGTQGVPDTCSFKKTPNSEPCGAHLWKQVKRGPLGTVKVPVKRYVHQHLKPWLGRFLSRRDMEKTAEEYPRSCMSMSCAEVTDVWQGDVLRKIRDPRDRKAAFFPGPPSELRLAFALSVDGFHPFQMKPAGQNAASTGIWLVLLNLPWDLRYRPENIYLAGVIPGPNKPSNDQINHYVQLIVNDFQELNYPGIHFSRTHDLREGRTCRGMLIPLICDLLGAHQVVGYPGAPTAHYFCTSCELDIDDINVIDPDEWPKKDIRHIRRYAQIYRDADSERDQQVVFDGCGWRWSPLFELEYWDPVLFTVIDSMHAIDLNLIKHHIHNLFQIDTLPGHNRGDALRPPTSERIKRIIASRSELRELKKCQHIIYENAPELLYQLLAIHRKALYSFSVDYDIRSADQNVVTGTRWVLARNIYKWRQQVLLNSVQDFLNRYPDLSPQQTALIEEAEGSEATEGEESDVEENEGDADPDTMRDTAGDNGTFNPSGDDNQPSIKQPTVQPQDEERPSEPAVPATLKVGVLRRNAKKIIEYIDGEDEDGKPLFDKITVAILEHFCNILSLDYSSIDEWAQVSGLPAKKVTRKRKLFDFLVDTLRSDHKKKKQLYDHFSEESVPSSAAFLGIDVMQEVWRDMQRTQLPTWITPAPRDWGTSRRGKLSADNWRTICCIHLPITLLRLFGSSDGRPKDLVDNFMQLVSAVRIATMWTSSASHVEAYNDKIFAYTRGVLDLYPDYSLLPSHHAALHIGDMLNRFGPKHSHDSPYYERYIRFFHRMNTNSKLGEVEGTFLRTAMRNANLLALLSESLRDRELVESMLQRLDKHHKEGLRGFRLAEVVNPVRPVDSSVTDARSVMEPAYAEGGKYGRLPPALFRLLCGLLGSDPEDTNRSVSPNAVFVESAPHMNNVYAIWDSSRYKDSAIIFQSDHEEKAGIIREIFVHKHCNTFRDKQEARTYAAIDSYPKVNDDHFRRYGHAGGFCCKRAPLSKELVPLESIICHSALTEFEEEDLLHVLPVNRTTLSLEVEQHNLSL